MPTVLVRLIIAIIAAAAGFLGKTYIDPCTIPIPNEPPVHASRWEQEKQLMDLGVYPLENPTIFTSCNP